MVVALVVDLAESMVALLVVWMAVRWVASTAETMAHSELMKAVVSVADLAETMVDSLVADSAERSVVC